MHGREMQRIGVFGASFNPPTLGHRNVIEQALPQFDQILLIPSVAHPFNKKLIPLAHRVAMLNLFLKEWPTEKKDRIKINLIEELLQKQNPGQPVYTYDVLVALKKYFQGSSQSVQLHFILGPDNSQPQVWHKFYRYADIEKNWPLFIATEQIPIHSTMVREWVAQHANNKKPENALSELVGMPIAHYILEHGLYREKD